MSAIKYFRLISLLSVLIQQNDFFTSGCHSTFRIPGNCVATDEEIQEVLEKVKTCTADLAGEDELEAWLGEIERLNHPCITDPSGEWLGEAINGHCPDDAPGLCDAIKLCVHPDDDDDATHVVMPPPEGTLDPRIDLESIHPCDELMILGLPRCQNGGKCIRDGDDYTCECIGPFEGEHCVIRSCDSNKVWKECGSACTPTCGDPNPTCTSQCIHRCECPDELPLLHDGKCIRKDQCRCADKWPFYKCMKAKTQLQCFHNTEVQNQCKMRCGRCGMQQSFGSLGFRRQG